MATITSATIVESITRGGTKRNRYRYTLDTGETHERRGWIPVAADSDADMSARGAQLLDELAETEIRRVLNVV
jgi:hypothetical protein